MEAYEFRAYEVCGFWTMVVVRVYTADDGRVERDLMYKGDHVPIDEPDPLVRACLLLSRVEQDLNWTMSDPGLRVAPGA